MQSTAAAKRAKIHWLVARRNLNISLCWREECSVTPSTPPPTQKVKASPFMYSCAVAVRTQIYWLIMLSMIGHFTSICNNSCEWYSPKNGLVFPSD
jgi:hypothetical protein